MQMQNMKLNWIKCGDNPSMWCDFLNVNLAHDHFKNLQGVYVIWHGGQNPWTVKLGQGEISKRLLDHRADREILAFREYGLMVSWAQSDSIYRDGAEAYLANILNPKVGERFPDRSFVQVNLPWD